MSRKICIDGDVYSEDAIAFVRRMRKPAKPPKGMAQNTHVVNLKAGHSLDGSGKITTIFLTEEEGKKVLAWFREGATQ